MNPVEIGRPSVYTIVTPRSRVIVTNVAIKACTLPLAMMMPLIAPSAAPASKAVGTATRTGTSIATKVAAKAPHSANTEPTLKSIPAVKMTKVIPTAMIALTEVWRRIFSKLSTVKKFGFKKETTITKNSSAISDFCSINHSLLSSFLRLSDVVLVMVRVLMLYPCFMLREQGYALPHTPLISLDRLRSP
ncbi:Uncharacterised protein [Vibrio cholerae]|nr:Uncharacterised protein [Vibrio cholerae]